MQKVFGLACLLLLLVGLVALAQGVIVAVSGTDDLGEFLVDGEGRTLYAFTQDQEGVSFCYYGCAENWPPLLTEGKPSAGEQINASLLGTIERTDGSLQVTYNGRPLYYFREDEAPNDTHGQAVEAFGGEWYVVSPSGDLVGNTDTAAQRSEDMQAIMTAGEQIYGARCRVCHAAGTGPTLEGNQNLANREYVINTILNGRANGAMPAWRDILNNEEIAAVATYIRNGWGNDFGPVTPEQVQSIRGH